MKQLPHAQLAKSRNDVNCIELWLVQGRKVRIRIRSNHYKEQCHAIAEVWTEVGWREVWSLDTGAMQTPEGLVYKREDVAASFDDDRATLLAATEAVLKGGA